MIAVDTSAIVAILRHEDEEANFIDILDGSESCMSVASYLEAHMVMTGRRKDSEAKKIDLLLSSLAIEIVPISIDQGRAAITAFWRFGKGRHPASLNLADCMTYALASSLNIPLLFTGDDFAQTDIVPAWRPQV